MRGGVGHTMLDSSVSNPKPSAGWCRHQACRPSLRRVAASASLLTVLATVLPAAAQNANTQSAKTTPHEVASRPQVYLMRGLLNIFSLGMDQLAAQIERRGIDASVYNHSVADTVVDRIVQEYRAGDHGPYILIGHSLGADAVMTMAQQLNRQGVPVALVVPFDGTASYAAPGNVACVLNLTQRKYAYMVPGAGFHGKLSNVDVSSDTSVDHFTIDKSPRLQAKALNSVLQAVHGQPCQPGASGPAIARQKQPPSAKSAAKGAPLASPTKSGAPAKIASPTKSASPASHSGYQG
jgi:Thioesterase domain